MSAVRGLAVAPEPSLRRRAGISARPVDLEGLILNRILNNILFRSITFKYLHDSNTEYIDAAV